MVETATHAVEAAEKGISVHLAPQILTHVWGIPVTNTILTSTLIACGVLLLAFIFRNSYTLMPSKFQILLEAMFSGAFTYIAETLESEKLAKKFFPVIMTIFLFILSLNWIGLLPGVDSIGIYTMHEGHSTFVPFLHPANTDLNITFAFALIAFVTIEFAGIALLGFLKYGSKFVNLKKPLSIPIGLIELVGEIARLASFSFRLFGNVFAGKMLLLVAIFFVPFVVPVPVLAFELFVGFVQALVFAILTLFFIKLAVAEPH